MRISDWSSDVCSADLMKILASLLVATAIAALGAWEAFWRFDHFPSGDVAAPATGNYIAQIHTLPEGSVRPYSQGVFVRHRYIPLWVTSKLVFAGYCKPEIGRASCRERGGQ